MMSPPVRRSANLIFLRGVALIVAALGVMWLLLFSHQPGGQGGLAVGSVMPDIKAEGWVNGAAPTTDELRGKVLVIEAWATWCVPCRQNAPELIDLYEKYQEEGVEFIGLTAEPAAELDNIRQFMTDTGIKWRNGYGAVETLLNLQADATPMVWVVDRQGRIAWNFDSPTSLDQGIKQALNSNPVSN